jgi:dipeptidyl-peptidase-4
MNPGGTFFVDAFSSRTVPPTVVLRAADGRAVRPMASTDVAAVAALGLVPPELLTLKAADGVTTIHGSMHKPADFDPARRYPVIVNVYGGPHTKAVRNQYATTGFEAALAQFGFLVVQIDARGTLGRGKAFQAGNYLRLGQVDVDDHAAAMRQLAERPYVDGSRVGVTGISHGGFMTLMMKLRYPEIYQVAAAGAPLTDLRLGPRQYIGRFMRTPEANPEGYDKANVLNYADRVEGRLLIFHGTDDRNAVIGNTMQLVRRFIDAARPVDMMIYPEGVHVLEGADAGHNMRLLVSYFLEHLKPDAWERSREALWSRR